MSGATGDNVGERLLRACVDSARVRGGVEPLAVRLDGKLYDEILMVVRP